MYRALFNEYKRDFKIKKQLARHLVQHTKFLSYPPSLLCNSDNN